MSSGFTEDWLEAHNRKVRKPTQFTITSEGRETPEGIVYDITPKSPRSKYRNRKMLVVFRPEGEIVAGHLRLSHEFDSKKEADHFAELALRRQSGQITNLVLQRPFALIARADTGAGVIVGEWFADFSYDEYCELIAAPGREAVVASMRAWSERIVDVKSAGTRTQTYQLKKKIVEACHGITITEV